MLTSGLPLTFTFLIEENISIKLVSEAEDICRVCEVEISPAVAMAIQTGIGRIKFKPIVQWQWFDDINKLIFTETRWQVTYQHLIEKNILTELVCLQ